MTATPEGGRKTARKLLGDDPLYYIKLASKGGKASRSPLKGDSDWGRRMAKLRKKSIDK